MAGGRDASARAPHRVLVVGSSNAGKTTLGRTLAARLEVPVVELDALHWGPDWTPVDDDVFRRRVDEALAASPSGWVIDGNYEGKLGDRLWQEADLIVFLDLGLPTLLYRTVRRTVVRSITREALYSGNRERLRYLFARDSLVWFTLRHYKAKRRRWAARADDPTYAQATRIRLTSGRQVRRWLNGYAPART